MSSNVQADERTLTIPSPESPVTDTSSIVREKSPRNDTKSPGNLGNAYLVYQLRRNSYQQYEQQLDRISPGHHHHSQHPVANMSSMLGSNTVVPPGVLPPLDHYRLQLYNYAMAERLRCSQYSTANGIGNQLQMCAPGYPSAAAAAAAAAAVSAGSGPYAPSRFALSMSFFHNRAFQPEEPKPQHSYIGLIAMAILNSPDSKLVLSDIYQHILDNYPYFRTRGPGWRNSIRHNLSLNDCFIKAGRSANGKGHYWAIHPANLEDFKKGDFRRRKAQRKVRKHMGLAVDDDGTDSSSPPPLAVTPPPTTRTPQGLILGPNAQSAFCAQSWAAAAAAHAQAQAATAAASASAVEQRNLASSIYSQSSRKRQFDVASLLAPDEDDSLIHRNARCQSLSNSPRHNRYHQQRGQYNEGQHPQHHSYSKGSNAKRISLGPTEYAESENDEDIDVVASDAENNNNTTNPENTVVDDENAALLLGYNNDDEECIIGEDLQRDEINDDSPKSTPIINQLDQQHHHQKHDPPTLGAAVNDDDNVLTDCSNDSNSAARAAAAASWHGIIQHWPGNFQHLNITQGTANTRILQRYYGQYMAAAAAQQAAAAAIVAKTRRSSSIGDTTNDPISNENTQQQQHQQIHHQHHHHHPHQQQQQQLPSCNNENPSGLSRNEC